MNRGGAARSLEEEKLNFKDEAGGERLNVSRCGAEEEAEEEEEQQVETTRRDG